MPLVPVVCACSRLVIKSSCLHGFTQTVLACFHLVMALSTKQDFWVGYVLADSIICRLRKVEDRDLCWIVSYIARATLWAGLRALPKTFIVPCS